MLWFINPNVPAHPFTDNEAVLAAAIGGLIVGLLLAIIRGARR